MPTNDFIGFASSGSANIMSQADFAAAAEQTDGVQPGPASSALANKIWRQGANMASALGSFIAAQGYDAYDDGDIAALTTALKKALFNSTMMSATIDDTKVDTGKTNGCRYYRVGNIVVVSGQFALLASSNTYAGTRIATGLPFNNDTTSSAMYGCVVQDNHYIDAHMSINNSGSFFVTSRAIALNTSNTFFWGAYYAD